MWTDKLKLGVLGVCVLALAACGTPRSTSTAGTGAVPVTTTTASTTGGASGMGVVQAVEVVPREQAQAGIGLGTVAGAVVGGVLGNQVGGGSGRTAATIAGTAGGALAGHEMEKNSQASGGSAQVYRIAVRMDNGAVQTLMQETPPQVQTGERVRLENGVIVERFR